MNKKIKVIDLIDKKYHNLELPKHIRINKLEYFYNENRKTYDSEYGEQMSFDFTDNVLNMEVEILEENTEEIEEIEEIEIRPYKGIDYNFQLIENNLHKLAKAVNEIRKDLNK